VDQIELKNFGVVEIMFKQNIKRKKSNKSKSMRYRRKKQKNYGVCFHAEKNGMCAGKKKCKK